MGVAGFPRAMAHPLFCVSERMPFVGCNCSLVFVLGPFIDFFLRER